MHVVERGVDEAVIVDDVIIRVLEIVSASEVRVAISSPASGLRYQEMTLRVDDSERTEFVLDESAVMLHS